MRTRECHAECLSTPMFLGVQSVCSPECMATLSGHENAAAANLKTACSRNPASTQEGLNYFALQEGPKPELGSQVELGLLCEQ